MLKKNRMIKIVATALASFLALSVSAGCFANQGNTSSNTSVDVEQEDKVRGTHERTVTETNVDLVKNGQTDYVIVTPANENHEAALFAVSELRQNFFRATGITLDVKTDAEMVYTSASKVLSIGETSFLQTAGVTLDKNDLGTSGYVVQTKNNSVFMVGGSGYGSLYAVYGWLSEQFDYEYYAIGETYIQTELTEEKLLSVTLKEKPDFAYRMTNFGEAWFDLSVAHRARFDPANSIWVTFGGAQYHTSFNIVPPEIYMEEHPDWYAKNGEQLCFSRDPDGLAEVAVENMKEAFRQFPDRNIATFTQQDHFSWCDCQLCTEALQKYGTNSAVYIKFVNKIADELAAWAKEEFNGREITIAMFAYQKTEDAPVKETANGYEPIDDTVRLSKNVALFYAPIYASYYYDFNHEENLKAATTLEKWKVLSETLFVWMYGANFRLYLAPYNNFNSMQSTYRYLYDKGAKYIFDQQQFNQVSGTDWYKLRGYLSSNLQWKIDSDQTELINNFFTHYYKDASAAMKRLFDEEMTWFAYLEEYHGYNGTVSYTESTLLKEEFWPQGLLEGWLAIIDEAYKAIEPLKVSNPSMHETLTQRIKLESLTFRFMQLELYDVYYSEAQVEEMRESFKNDCIELGVRQYAESVAIGEYLR
jgi:hypothetical protein